MEVCRRSSWLLLLLGVSLLATTLQGVQGEAESEGPSESECRPYIEKALKELETGEPDTAAAIDSIEDVPTIEITTDDSEHQELGENDTHEQGSIENLESDQDDQQSVQETTAESVEAEPEPATEDTETDAVPEPVEEETVEQESVETNAEPTVNETDETKEEVDETVPETIEDTKEEDNETKEDTKEEVSQEQAVEETVSLEEPEPVLEAQSLEKESVEETAENLKSDDKSDTTAEEQGIPDENETVEDQSTPTDAGTEIKDETVEEQGAPDDSQDETVEEQGDSIEGTTQDEAVEQGIEDDKSESSEKSNSQEQPIGEEDKSDTREETAEEQTKSEPTEERADRTEAAAAGNVDGAGGEEDPVAHDEAPTAETEQDKATESTARESVESEGTAAESVEDSAPEEELSWDVDIPSDLRERNHVEHLLKIDAEASETEQIINRVAEITLKELKKLYENAIKPLEVLYKYRDLSNRHFGDAEIFSKPLILFMGPWSGGKSSIINYLTDNEYNESSLRTGAEPSPAYFNILMHGEEAEIWDGTQLAADFTFSGLQKFGQGLEERLRGVRLPSKLLEKVNIVEIPGILEVRKQVSRVFPFNDACQWFIDRADIIFLVYDPSKLDVGPETEAILDQLKGREHQTRIILNKADQVKPEELMRVQGALIWNISPLMSSPQPPVMYTASLWSRPFETWAPVRLLQAQERSFLRDLRSAIDKRIENKISSARRFAVRVRNHAKMVDCYLTTYYNHKSVFGNRKQVADAIIEHPQDYHIYEGLSTLTNISRYDLPDPEVYREFFKLNPLYEFQQLSATCTYFRGCPINRLDVAIAYDLPELIGKHKRLVESALAEGIKSPVPSS